MEMSNDGRIKGRSEEYWEILYQQIVNPETNDEQFWAAFHELMRWSNPEGKVERGRNQCECSGAGTSRS